jgi:hypothetical protein
MTDAADGGIADRGGGRGSYRVIDFNAGQILQRPRFVYAVLSLRHFGPARCCSLSLGG